MGKYLPATVRLSDHLVLLEGAADRAARHRLVRRFVADLLGCADEAVALRHDSAGKPHLAGAALCLNLAYRDGLLLIGTAADPIGVDVEFMQDGRDVARALFSPAEARWLDSSTAAASFARLWTAKEAVLKAAGLGITGGMAEPDLSPLLQPGRPFDADQCDVAFAGCFYRVGWHAVEVRGRPAMACSAIRHPQDTFSRLPLPAPAPRCLAAHAG